MYDTYCVVNLPTPRRTRPGGTYTFGRDVFRLPQERTLADLSKSEKPAMAGYSTSVHIPVSAEAGDVIKLQTTDVDPFRGLGTRSFLGQLGRRDQSKYLKCNDNFEVTGSSFRVMAVPLPAWFRNYIQQCATRQVTPEQLRAKIRGQHSRAGLRLNMNSQHPFIFLPRIV